jgi:paraquat-inducible protein B
MSADAGSAGAGGDAKRPEVKKGRFWLVWLIPIVAAGYGGYVGLDSYLNQGPVITIYFETGDGLEAGKTKIKYRSVEAGTVESVHIRAESPQVVVTCRLTPQTRDYLKEGTKFWVVRPRVGFGGISGLGTLVSGAYIAADFPGEGKPTREFVGLEAPPVAAGEAGLHFKLHASKLGSLTVGAPIYYREIEVGVVGDHELSKDGRAIEFDALIRDEYKHLLQDNSRFWNAGGIDVHIGAGAVDIRTESLTALIAGGVTFDARPGGKPAAAGADFLLYDSMPALEEADQRYGGLSLVLEAAALGSLIAGDPVTYRGEIVGSVVSSDLATDARTVRAKVNIYNRYRSLVRDNSIFWNASGISADLGLSGLHIHAGSLQSLLRGGVAFATPNAPGALVKSGSVFKLHAEVKDDWVAWRPLLWLGPPGEKPKEAPPEKENAVERFFHHDDKSEDEAKKDETPNPDHEEKEGFFKRLFH